MTLSSNLPGTIYYIVVDAEVEYTKEQILNPVDVLFSGNGAAIDVSYIMPNPETTYFVYAIAILPDRESLVFDSSGLSSSATYVNYGTGTVADPFILRTVADLENIGNGAYVNEFGVALAYANNAHYPMANDLDLTAKYGEGLLNWTPIAEFYGVFDGGGYTISGPYINAPESVTHNGFTAYLRADAVVKNLTFDGAYVNVRGQQTDGTTGMTGIVAGRMNSSRVENIRIINATVISQGFRVGAIAGGNEGTAGHMVNLYVEANVTGWARVGGIIGNVSNSSTAPFNLKNIVFKGDVTMIGNVDFRVGGIVGWARGTIIENIFVEGSIGGVGAIAGGVAGYLESFSDTTNFAAIKNALINVVVISSVGRAGSLVGNVSSTASKIPALINAFQTSQTTMIIQGSASTSTRHAVLADESLFDALWFETNWPGTVDNIAWSFVSGNDRPTLLQSPDDGIIAVLDIPLVVTDASATGANEKAIVLAISTNRGADVIYYVVTVGGSYDAQTILAATVGGEFLFVGNGQAIAETITLPGYGISYQISYIVKNGDAVSEVFVKNVVSGAEVPLSFTASAAAGEVLPGDLVVQLLSTSHPAAFKFLVLPADHPAPDRVGIETTGTLLESTLTLSLVPGAAYKIYLIGSKTDGTSNGSILVLEASAKAEPEAPFVLSTATMEATNVPGELVLTIVASHEATITYLLQLASDPVPTTAEILANGIAFTNSPLTMNHNADVEYTVYIHAAKVGSDAVATQTITVKTARALYNGNQTASYYPIYALEDLEAFRDGVNSGAILNTATLEFFADIDLSSKYAADKLSWIPIGDLVGGTVKYKGSVLGNNHVINGLYISRSTASGDIGTGFFGTTDAGFQLIDLHFTNVNVTGSTSVGAVVGYAKVALMQNVSVVGGTVTSTHASDSRVGGLIGRLNSAGTAESVVELVWTDVAVVGSKHVGGLIGHVDYSADSASVELIIRDVYTLGTVSSTLASSANVGGVIGYLRATLIRAIAYGTVTNASTQSAGVVGYAQNRSATTVVVAEVIDLIAANGHTKVVGQVSTSNGAVTVTNNLLVVASDPVSGQITLAQLIELRELGHLDSAQRSDVESVRQQSHFEIV
ncbi:MAG: hypothetical protein MZU97_26340 [Bacillus subtilis]|nr:hypothetical protein [Bacillus subtilis]